MVLSPLHMHRVGLYVSYAIFPVSSQFSTIVNTSIFILPQSSKGTPSKRILQDQHFQQPVTIKNSLHSLIIQKHIFTTLSTLLNQQMFGGSKCNRKLSLAACWNSRKKTYIRAWIKFVVLQILYNPPKSIFGREIGNELEGIDIVLGFLCTHESTHVSYLMFQ